MSKTTSPSKPQTRIQKRNIMIILDAALEVFSTYGFRGTTLDQIARQAGLSKPNVLYYFDGKEAIHLALLSQLLETWLDPLRAIDPQGDPKTELMRYIRHKLQMSRDFSRESRLFANEIVQGAPRMQAFLQGDLRDLVDEKAAVIQAWMKDGKLTQLDPFHLIFSIWALTQHYADFEAQIRLVRGSNITQPHDGSEDFLDQVFQKLLTP